MLMETQSDSWKTNWWDTLKCSLWWAFYQFTCCQGIRVLCTKTGVKYLTRLAQGLDIRIMSSLKPMDMAQCGSLMVESAASNAWPVIKYQPTHESLSHEMCGVVNEILLLFIACMQTNTRGEAGCHWPSVTDTVDQSGLHVDALAYQV